LDNYWWAWNLLGGLLTVWLNSLLGNPSENGVSLISNEATGVEICRTLAERFPAAQAGRGHAKELGGSRNIKSGLGLVLGH